MAADDSGRRAGETSEDLLRSALGTLLTPDMQPALARLLGRIAADRSLLTIGGGGQRGGVTLGDVAGGGIVRLTIIGSQHVGGPAGSPDDARQIEQFRLEARERIRIAPRESK